MFMIYNFPERSHYNVHKMIFDLRNSRILLDEFKNNREQVMDKYQLNEKEKKILNEGNPVKMYKFGIFPYLLHYYWTVIVLGAEKSIDDLVLYKED